MRLHGLHNICQYGYFLKTLLQTLPPYKCLFNVARNVRPGRKEEISPFSGKRSLTSETRHSQTQHARPRISLEERKEIIGNDTCLLHSLQVSRWTALFNEIDEPWWKMQSRTERGKQKHKDAVINNVLKAARVTESHGPICHTTESRTFSPKWE